MSSIIDKVISSYYATTTNTQVFDYFTLLTATPPTPTISLTANAPITLGKENGAKITAAITNGAFTANNPANWQLAGAQGGVTVSAVELKDGGATAELTLSGNSADKYTANNEVKLLCKSKEYSDSMDYTTMTAVDLESSNAITFTKQNRPSGGGGGTTITVPSVNPKSGNVSIGTKLELTTSYKDAKIYYTTDGTTPTADSALYTAPISIDKSMTVKYIVVTANGQTSAVGSQTFTVEFPKVSLKDNVTTIRYITGYSNGVFKPDVAITRYEMLTALNYVVDIEKSENSKVFPDVPQQYKELVGAFAGAGIIEGYDDGEFKGEQGLTRAEFVKVMSLILGVLPSQSKSDFADVSGHWAESYIADFTKLGVLKGYEDGLFHPDDRITRAEFTAVVNRIIKNANEPLDNIYSDLTAEHWAYSDILKAYLQ